MAIDYQPYSVVENRGFRELMAVVEPRYQLPSRTTFSRHLLPELYNKTKQALVRRITSDLVGPGDDADPCSGCPAFSFTTDCWTSSAMDPYISFTLSYLTSDFILHAVALENKPLKCSHTAEAILDSLEKSMESWNLPQEIPVFCVRDNGKNIKAAIRRSEWYDLACFAHTLQLAIGDAKAACDGVEAMLTKCRRLVTHYHHSCVASSRINSYQRARGQPEYDFIAACPTRWNSDLAMVSRLLVLKESVAADIAAVGDVENLTTSEWKMAEGFEAILKPLDESTRDSCGEKYPTRSMIIPLIFGMTENLQKFIADPSNRGFGVTFARKLLACIRGRFPSYQTAIPDCLATFLDPRFKALLFHANPNAVAYIEESLKEFGEHMIKAATTRHATVSQSHPGDENQSIVPQSASASSTTSTSVTASQQLSTPGTSSFS